MERAFKLFLFIILAPFYVPMALIMHFTFDWWTKLND